MDAGPSEPVDVVVLSVAPITSSTPAHRVEATVELPPGPWARVTATLDLGTTCQSVPSCSPTCPPADGCAPLSAGCSTYSDCDPWDRSITVSAIDPARPADPALELIRAITPFGGAKQYVEDVSDYARYLSGTKTLRVEISAWVGGWTVSLTLHYEPGPPARPVLAVVPLFYYASEGGAYHGPTATPLTPATVTVPPEAAGARLRYRTTGHGASGALVCEEFCYKLNEVRVDGVARLSFGPWRADCSALCAAAPSCSTVALCTVDNPWGAPCSVYAPRAGWCPGDRVAPNELDAGAFLPPGDHTIDFTIPMADPAGSWLVSLDAVLYGPPGR